MPRSVVSIAILAAVSGLAAPAPDCEADGPPDGSTFMDVDVTGYDFTFDVGSRQATSVVTMEVLTRGECISMDFRQVDAASILIGGAPAEWSQIADGKLEACGDTAFPRDTVTLSASMIIPVGTDGQTDIGYATSRDTDGYLHHYMNAWFEGCSLFGPCYDDPNDFAPISFHVTHPVGYRLLCPGQLTPGDTRSSCTMTTPVPTYSGFGFMLSPGWIRTPLATVGGVDVEVYDLFGVQVAEALDVDAWSGFFAWIQSQLSPYPYGDALRFEVGPHYWWGFEHPGNVAIAEDLIRVSGSYQDPLLHVMMHETAHMWSGNLSTPETVYDFVWKEAFAEYLTFVYEDEALSPAHATRTLRIWLSSAVDARYHPVPEGEPALLDFYTDVYGAGAMILGRQLEVLLGRDTVMAALSELLAEGSVLSIDDVQTALEVASGEDLTEYFNEWVYGDGIPRWPVLAVELTAEGDGQYEMQVRQVQNTAFIYGLKTTIRLGGDLGQELEVPINYGIDGDDDSITLTVNPGFTVTSYIVDPKDEALVFGAGVEAARFAYPPIRPF